MKRLLTVWLVCLLAPAAASAEPNLPVDKEQAVVKHVQAVSFTIVSKGKSGSGEGSGVIKTRKLPDGSTVSFVWTAAHVVENLRHTKTIIDSKTGTSRTMVEFDDAMVVKSLVVGGRLVGKTELYAEVIRFSPDEDLALLRVRMPDFIGTSANFFAEKDEKGQPLIPAVGTSLIHCGSLLGQMGSNSVTEGIMSQHGRLVNKKVFDQTTVTAFPGSSGGGVFLKDGRLAGLVLRGAGETFNLICPVRRMSAWAKSAKVEWAMDDAVPVPGEEEMQKLPIEDNGTHFSYSARADGSGKRLVTLGSGPYYLGTHERECEFPTFYYFKSDTMPAVKD